MMMTAVGLATLWLSAASALGAEPANGSPLTEARRLATIPQDAKLKSIFISPDPQRVGLIAKRGSKEFAVVNGLAGEEFDSIPSSLTFSSDGKHVAYIGRLGAEEFAVVNGVRGEGYDGIEAPTFSPNGSRLAYAAAKGARRYLVLDGLRGEEYDSL